MHVRKGNVTVAARLSSSTRSSSQSSITCRLLRGTSTRSPRRHQRFTSSAELADLRTRPLVRGVPENFLIASERHQTSATDWTNDVNPGIRARIPRDRALLLADEHPRRGEPHRQRRPGGVEDRSRRRRHARSAAPARPPAIQQLAPRLPATQRAPEPVRPAQPFQVVQARRIRRIPRPDIRRAGRTVTPARGDALGIPTRRLHRDGGPVRPNLAPAAQSTHRRSACAGRARDRDSPGSASRRLRPRRSTRPRVRRSGPSCSRTSPCRRGRGRPSRSRRRPPGRHRCRDARSTW
jgi:hypothetical protein